MLPNFSSDSQKGYVGLAVVVFMLMFAMLIYPNFFPSRGGAGACVVGTKPDSEVIVTWPAIDGGETGLPVEEQPTAQYKLIRKDVPVTSFTHLSAFYPEAWTGSDGVATHMIGIMYLNENQRLMYPKKNFGEHTIEPIEGKPQRGVHMFGEGLAFVMHMDGPSTPKIVARRVGSEEGRGGETEEEIRMVDVYQLVDKAKAIENGTGAFTYEELFQCDEGGALDALGINQGDGASPIPSGQSGAKVFVPNQAVSEGRDQLQLEWVTFNSQFGVWGTHCKPAVYLYPRVKQLVNVKVFPKGELTYTDPLYDSLRGWTVWVEPNGKLELAFSSQSSAIRQFDYLYYESKLRDEEIKKPQEGWVVRHSEMESLFEKILPKLGLNAQEKADFEDYWLSKLPKSPYYFVGLVDKAQRDYLETLSVTPNPDTSIRFSLFFEMLDNPRDVVEPIIETPRREGFTLVDWGGMMKLHPGTPFTCSQ